MPHLPRPRARLPRRAVIGGAAAVAATGGVLAACTTSAVPPAATAAPTPQQTGIELVFQANNQGVPWNKTTLALYQQFVDQNFTATHTGLRATVYPGGWGNPQAQIVASIAGSGYADVVHGCCDDIATLEAGGWLLPLDDYLRRDNIDKSIWSKGHVETLALGGKQMALPSYDGPAVMCYRQDLLDQLGLQYPDASWTAESALQLWQQCTGKQKNGRPRYGTSLFGLDAGSWQLWLRGWGGQVMNGAHDACVADSTAGRAALNYAVELKKAKINGTGGQVADLASGQAVFAMCGGWQVFQEATELGNKVKWDILPVPLWPAGRSTFGNIDFYGLNRATKHTDEAWQLMRWLTAEADWQRFQMRTTLVEPCLLQLWDEWETIVKSVAPPLQGKALHWYQDAAVKGYGWPTVHFAHAALQANTIVGNWLNKMTAGTVTVEEGLAQLSGQVNALEQAAALTEQAAVGSARQFPVTGSSIAVVTPGL